jgi:hypothetical protein
MRTVAVSPGRIGPASPVTRVTESTSGLASIAMMTAPCFLLGIVLLRRGLPTRVLAPALIIAITATAGGEAAWRLHCSYSGAGHLLIAHGAQALVFSLIAVAVLRWKR